MPAYTLCLLSFLFSLAYSPATVEGRGVASYEVTTSPHLVNQEVLDIVNQNMIRSSDVKVYTTEESILGRRHDYKGVVLATMGYTFNNKHKPNHRVEVLENLRSRAAEMGANTIVGLKMEENTPHGGTELVMYGTAVFLDPINFLPLE
jgi:uncharacterized protein YbjQ (UPF0145 family)